MDFNANQNQLITKSVKSFVLKILIRHSYLTVCYLMLHLQK